MKKFMTMAATLMAAVGLFSSCSKDDKGVDDAVNRAGDTYASISIALNGPGMRAYNDDPSQDFEHKGKWKGNDKIESVDLFLVSASATDHHKYTVNNTPSSDMRQVEENGQLVLKPNKAIETTKGAKKLYVVVNAPTTLVNELKAASGETAFKALIDNSAIEAYTAPVADADYSGVNIHDYAKYDSDKSDKVVMTNEDGLKEITIEEGVTQEEALRDNGKNHFVVNVKRVAARVVVTVEKESFEINADGGSNGNLAGTLTIYDYSVAQGERTFYSQQKKEEITWDGGQCAVIKTPGYVFGKDQIVGQDFLTKMVPGMKKYYDYSDLFHKTQKRKPETLTGGFSTVQGLVDLKAEPAFLLEANHKRNTAANNTPSKYDGDFYSCNTPYVLVRGTFKPKDSEKFFTDIAAYNAVMADPKKKAEYEELYTSGEKPKVNPDGTFYVGANGKYYADKMSIQEPLLGGEKDMTFRTYEKGKVLYYAYVNPNDGAAWKDALNAPAFRNNFYHIHINGIKRIGFNWNSLFPEDPTGDQKNPDPKPKDDPVTPPVPGDKPLGKTDVYMSVQVNVLEWDVHSYAIELDI